MIAPLFQNAALLLLAGAGLYAVWTQAWLVSRPVLQRVMTGVVLGLIGFLVTINPVLTPDGATLDARAGATLFAGFLGGPVGAVFAAGAGALARGIVGGGFAFSGMIVFVVYAAFGWALSLLRRGPVAQVLTPRTVVELAMLGLLGASLMYFLISPPERAQAWLLHDLPYIWFANLLSTGMVGAVCVFTLHRAQERIAAERVAERLKLATRAAGIGIWDYDLGTDAPNWDEGMHKIYGTTPESYDGAFEEWLTHIDERDHPLLRASFTDGVKGDKPMITEFRVKMGGGKIKHVRGEAIIIRDSAGQAKRMVGVNYDITDLRSSESREQAARTQFMAVAENVPGCVFQLLCLPDGTERFTFLSNTCMDVCGLECDEVLDNAQLLWSLAPPVEYTRLREAMDRAALAGRSLRHRWHMTDLGARDRWIEMRAVPETPERGQVRWNGVLFDVTDEAKEEAQATRREERAMHSQRLESIGKLTGGVAHDFNNLLAVIVGNVEFLRDELPNPEHAQFADNALQASMRGADLIRKLLSFARQARLEPEVFDLNEKLGTIEDWIGRVLPATIRMERKLADELPPIRADVTSVENAVLNLILNARDAMPNGGALTIETDLLHIGPDDPMRDDRDLGIGSYVMLSISDTGEGILPEVLPNVFEPFFTTKDPGPTSGSGLGLATVHGFMKQTGGSVRVYSEPGVGTSFKLFFPVGEAMTEAMFVPAAAGLEWPEPPLRILLAEDEPGVSSVICRMLTKAGYDVVPATNGDEAAELFDSDGPFDLLITDIVMPGKLQGPLLARTLREAAPDLPVVFMSGYAREATIHGNGLRPEDARLMKPILRADLARAVQQVMTTARKGNTAQ